MTNGARAKFTVLQTRASDWTNEQATVSLSAIAIERLKAKHLVQAHCLSTAVKWPHRLEDWNFALRLGRGFAALDAGELLGTVIWWPFGERYATLGMVIVSPTAQGRGLGRRLMAAALDEAGDRTTFLNATAEGLPLYAKLGFRPIGAVHRHEAANAVPAPLSLPQGGFIRALEEADLGTVVALDEKAAGFRRAEMLAALKDVGRGLVLEQDGEIAAWSFFRRFGRGYVIGPVGAPSEQAARALISRWIAENRSAFLRIDVPLSSGLSPWLKSQGLPQVGGVVTMAWGQAPDRVPHGPRLFSLANQSLG